MESTAPANRMGTKQATRKRRRLRVTSFAFFAVAILLAASPWLTGIYTAFHQRVMLGGLESSFDSAERAAKAQDASATIGTGQRMRGPFDGWAQEDAAYWKRLGDGKVFGRITIPKIGVNIAVVKGVSKTDLKLGPGWMTSTDMPGPTGNAVISGHRTTYLAPFKRIDELKRGDEIRIESPFRIYTYRVANQAVVDPLNKRVLEYSKRPMLTLTACHPEYSARQRLIVQAYLEGVKKR